MQRSPTLEGFRAILLRPSFGFAEIAWRWSFGSAAVLLLAFSCLEYLNTLPVGRSDLLLLRTGQPALVARALTHIFRGSAFRLFIAGIVISLALGIAWVIVNALARVATIRSMLAYFHDLQPSPATSEHTKTGKVTAMFMLNFLRLGVTLAAALALFAAVVLASRVSRPDDPAPGSALLIVLTVAMLVWLAWSILNWVLSLAAIFAVARGHDAFGSIAAAVELCRVRAQAVFSAGTCFGVAHLTAFALAGSIAAFPLGFAGVLPAGVVLGGMLLVALLYFAIADFLYAGRLAAYVAILELPELPAPAATAPSPLPQGGTHLNSNLQSSPAVDASELILSDVPASS
jgi:hypothetical protein